MLLCGEGLELSVFLVGPSGATLLAKEGGNADVDNANDVNDFNDVDDDRVVTKIVSAVRGCVDESDVYSKPPAWAGAFLQALCHVKKSMTVQEAKDDLAGMGRRTDRHDRIVSIVSSSGDASSSASWKPRDGR